MCRWSSRRAYPAVRRRNRGLDKRCSVRIRPMASAADRQARLAGARLYLVIDSPAAPEVVPAALAGGTDIVQLREKHAPDDEIVASARSIREQCERHGA